MSWRTSSTPPNNGKTGLLVRICVTTVVTAAGESVVAELATTRQPVASSFKRIGGDSTVVVAVNELGCSTGSTVVVCWEVEAEGVEHADGVGGDGRVGGG